MTEAIIVAVISLIGTALGAWSGVKAANNLTIYRIKQLEDKMDKYNGLKDRMTCVEKDVSVIKDDIKELKEGKS